MYKIKQTKNILMGLALTLASATASATIIDFMAMGNTSEYGAQPLSVDILTINGYYNLGNGLGNAYLDSNWGGLGVCKVLDSSAQCNPASDDNVTTGESLNIAFNSGVTINKIWFNNNHDGDLSLLGDTININGSNNTFSTGDQTNQQLRGNGDLFSDWLYTGAISINGGGSFDISFVNESFYVSAIEYSVPEPAMLGLLALGLIGIGISKRKKA